MLDHHAIDLVQGGDAMVRLFADLLICRENDRAAAAGNETVLECGVRRIKGADTTRCGQGAYTEKAYIDIQALDGRQCATINRASDNCSGLQ